MFLFLHSVIQCRAWGSIKLLGVMLGEDTYIFANCEVSLRGGVASTWTGEAMIFSPPHLIGREDDFIRCPPTQPIPQNCRRRKATAALPHRMGRSALEFGLEKLAWKHHSSYLLLSCTTVGWICSIPNLQKKKKNEKFEFDVVLLRH